jgi:HD-GYP domain-containing protein (c-di-GMP phosphodiesterase class II)
VQREPSPIPLTPHCLDTAGGTRDGDILVSNWKEQKASLVDYQHCFSADLLQRTGPIHNFILYSSHGLLIVGFNYGKDIDTHDAAVFQNLMTYSHFLRIISDEVQEVEGAFLYTIESLARAAEANDEQTANHIQRVNVYAELLAAKLGCPEEFTRTIRYSAQMHDVGKIHVPPDILRKPGALTPEEMATMKRHTSMGARILGEAPRLALSREIALSHHEKWDGAGYPGGLKGEAIPLAGRIVAMADIYDALRTKRCYKPGLSHEDACRIIREGDGRVMPGHFDPQVLGAFVDLIPRFEETYIQLSD